MTPEEIYQSKHGCDHLLEGKRINYELRIRIILCLICLIIGGIAGYAIYFLRIRGTLPI